MSRMLRSSGAVGAATLLSRLLGFVRERAYATFMGTGPVADAFILAFQIPNLFRRLLGEGALTAAFVPIFKAREAEGDPNQVWHATNAVTSALIVVCALVAGVAMIGITVVLGTMNLEYYTELMLRLLRMMFPYLLLVCVAAVFIGILNARGHYFLPALGATMLNVVMIASVYVAAPRFGAHLDQQVFALALGVLVAGVAQAGFQVPTLWAEGYRFRWVTPWRDPTVREVVRRMGPATLGVAAFQVNVLLTQTLAYSKGSDIVSSFNYAVRLMELPQGVFGISLATYMLTELSGLAAEKKYPEFRSTLQEGLLHLVYINALATALLVSLAEPMVRLLFEYGRFTPDSTVRVSFALLTLAPGLLAFSLNNVLARAFYALGDTSTPMKVSVMCLGLNLVLVILLLPLLRQGGLGVANSTSAAVNVALLLYALKRKLPKLDLRALRNPCAAMAGAAVLAGLAAWGGGRWWTDHLGHGRAWLRIGEVFAPMLVATAIYWGVTHWLNIPQAREIVNLLRLRRAGSGRSNGTDPDGK
jgi:putative peptidoglycan lipid II flippase